MAAAATFGLASRDGGTTGGLSSSPRGGPLLDSVADLLVVVDARIDNHDELCRSLGCPAEASEGELVLRGYQRWGVGLADAICGDFALAVWDGRRRMLYAARDPFGVKGMYFSSTVDRLLISNEVEPLVAHVDRRAIDEQMALDYLTTSFGHHRKTFFRDIARLQAGHYLLATERSCRQVRYFFPPRQETRLPRTEDYQQEFKRLLTESVRARLRSTHPVVAHLSGGLDSTSIVLLADEIYRTDPAGLPPLSTASAVFPGLACDESDIIAATNARVSFRGERWIGTEAGWEHLDNPTIAWPGSPAPISGGSAGDREIAKRLNARVILSGGGGDEISFGGGVFRDLAAGGRWLTLLRQTVGSKRFARANRWMYLKDSGVALVPAPLRRLRRFMTLPREGAAPEWLGPDLLAIWPSGEDDWNETHVRFHSWTQQGIWRSLVTATTGVPMDYRSHYGAEAGIELRFPFLDRRLVQFVLSIPWKYRMPNGFMRLLQWKGLEDRLPPEIFSRRLVVTSESARIREGENGAQRYMSLFRGEEWCSGRYVRQSMARRLLEVAMNKPRSQPPSRLNSKNWQIVQRVATLETWLRAVIRYIPPPEASHGY